MWRYVCGHVAVWKRYFSHTNVSGSQLLILGIETSCDDTAAAVVRGNGEVLGEAIHSQTDVHLRTGGIVPIVAAKLHEKNIAGVVRTAIEKSGCGYDDLSHVAVTTGPGLAYSLKAGVDFAKQLAKKINKPLISVHHMEAHALTARLEHAIPFPYLVLLVSGGHCILATVEGVKQFSRLGQTGDDSPGEAFDKVARWLRLDLHHDVCELVGGAAMEVLAREGCEGSVSLPNIMVSSRCCNFSFSGVKTAARSHVIRTAEQHNWDGNEPLPGCEDVCASFQRAVTAHLVTRTHRAMLYIRRAGLDVHHLVVSGGVARNNYIRSKLEDLCAGAGFKVHFPSPHLCTDNGVMIAWTGVEAVRAGVCEGVYCVENVDKVDYTPKWPLGKDISQKVIEMNIRNKETMTI